MNPPALFERTPLVDPAPERNPWTSLGASVAFHLVLIALLVIQASRVPPRPAEADPKPEPDVALSFEDPRPLLETQPFVPRPVPSPPPPPAVAPAPTEPAPPPPPPPADEAPLLGWNSKQGREEGRADRPPGPEGPIHAPPPPGGGSSSQPEAAVPEPPAAATDAVDESKPAVPPSTEGSAGLERSADGESPARRFEREEPSTPRAEPTPTRRYEIPEPPRPGEGTGGSGRGRGSGPGAGPEFNSQITGGLFGDVRFDSGDYNWSDYSTKVYFAVYRAWLRELLGRARRFERDQNQMRLMTLDAQVAIHFYLTRAGPVEAIDIVRPSPIPTLDEASAAALRRAVMPPLPADFPRDQEGVTFLFRISGFETAVQLERQLQWAQSNGEF